MTMEKVVEILRVEKQCVERSMLYCCDTDCADCDLKRYDPDTVLNAYTLAIEHIENNVVNKIHQLPIS